MIKYIVLFLMIFSFPILSTGQPVKLDVKMVQKDMDTLHSQRDSALHVGKQIVDLMKDEIKTYGIKKTIQINTPIFLPFILFAILFLVWLKNKSKE